MSESTYTFRVDEDLKTAFAAAAKAQDRNAAQLLRDYMRDVVQRQSDTAAHDTWFRKEVEQAVREADDRSVERIPHQQVRTSWRQQRAALVKRGR